MVSVSDLQRSTAKVMKLVDENEYVLVLHNNKPRVALIRVDKYQTLLNNIRTLEKQSIL